MPVVLSVVDAEAEADAVADREPETEGDALQEALSEADGLAELLAEAVGLGDKVTAALTVHVGVDERVAERLWDLVGPAVSEAVRLGLSEPEGEPVEVRDTDKVRLTVLLIVLVREVLTEAVAVPLAVVVRDWRPDLVGLAVAVVVRETVVVPVVLRLAKTDAVAVVVVETLRVGRCEGEPEVDPVVLGLAVVVLEGLGLPVLDPVALEERLLDTEGVADFVEDCDVWPVGPAVPERVCEADFVEQADAVGDLVASADTERLGETVEEREDFVLTVGERVARADAEDVGLVERVVVATEVLVVVEVLVADGLAGALRVFVAVAVVDAVTRGDFVVRGEDEGLRLAFPEALLVVEGLRVFVVAALRDADAVAVVVLDACAVIVNAGVAVPDFD